MDVLIRDVRLEDAEAVVGILNPIIAAGAYTVLEGPLTGEVERAFIAGFPARGVFHVAESRGGRVVGWQTLEPFGAYTHAFDHVGVIATYVDLACRRQGIGRRLFEATFDRARQKGYEKIFTHVRGDNPAALAAYLKAGFQLVGTAARHARIAGRYIDEIMIERFL
ncbi:MAG: GNAT family N-acetyltransferase [Planctomycetes bacterium]|nr:GNAT family N-acetyltransferase [Planctomycetota bacterium]